MRKSFEGLSNIIEEKFPGELLTGSFFIFLNRQRDHMKVMFWDKDGFVIFYKRLEKGSFPYKWGDSTSIDRRQFFYFLRGSFQRKFRLDFLYKKSVVLRRYFLFF